MTSINFPVEKKFKVIGKIKFPVQATSSERLIPCTIDNVRYLLSHYKVCVFCQTKDFKHENKDILTMPYSLNCRVVAGGLSDESFILPLREMEVRLKSLAKCNGMSVRDFGRILYTIAQENQVKDNVTAMKFMFGMGGK